MSRQHFHSEARFCAPKNPDIGVFATILPRYANLIALCAAVVLFQIVTAYSQSLDDISIEIKGPSREFSFTNKESAFFYGETHASNKSSWQGFNVFGHEFLDDYHLIVEGKRVERQSATKVIVYPDYLKRFYASGIVEELRLVDSLPLFSVTIMSPKPIDLVIIPYFTDGRSTNEFEIVTKAEIGCIARKTHLTKTEKENYPIWLVAYGQGFLPQKKEAKRDGAFSPIMLSARKARSHTLAFCVADELEVGEAAARTYIANKQRYHDIRRARMEKLLKETYVETDNVRFNKALAWVKLSLDALMMNQVTKGIFAGLPWFNNYWGRDTFISLPGATLVQGRFTEAKEILRSFATFQQLDSSSSDYGRIPNIVTTTEKAYNTADGTPRFVMMAREYIERSGDTMFVTEIYPTVLRSIEGTIKFHCDSLAFLTHGDAETWMDAVGPDGPWSPRGNRANDIQALWAQQLEAGIWFATRLGDVTSARRWDEKLRVVKENFSKYFINEGVVIDHLNKDGSIDHQLRPNQVFVSTLLDELTRASVLHAVVNNLTYEYGVVSLSLDDDNFHPYHQYDPYYPKDAAYHNGTVWTWVQGEVISELCHFGKHELAWEVTANTINQILDRGAVGTQSELIDAIARPGENEPRLSGTFSQAWNLAEFIRNFYDDYLGIRVSLLKHHLVLHPKLPKSLGSIKATINLNGRSLPIEVRRNADSVIVFIDGQNLRKGGTADFEFSSGDGLTVQSRIDIPPNSKTTYSLKNTAVSLYINGVNQTTSTSTTMRDRTYPQIESLSLARPYLRQNLQALRGPEYPVLSNAQIKRRPKTVTLFAQADDPAGDDSGTGAYSYPGNPAFVKGSFDLMKFGMSFDSTAAYFSLRFKTLSNPSWHPEYGFQLTFIAIAIDEDGLKNSGKQLVERNANYLLPDNRAYEKIIFVGGGVRLEDKSGKILAAYIPTESDVSDPLGDAETGTISFAIPLSYLAKPSRSWSLTILTGAQDDHGGAGIGEFRLVRRDVGEWNGGGKQNPGEPNVYDTLVISQ